MDENSSIFFDEWRRCLREHYKHVIRTQDTITEPTLHRVLQTVGIADEEIRRLGDEAHKQQNPDPDPNTENTPPEA